MVITAHEKLTDILSSYRTMKECLHWWDTVSRQIGNEVERVEAEEAKSEDQIDPNKIREFTTRRDEFFKLTAREIQDNVDNLEYIETGLKVTAVAGLAIPTGVAAFSAAPVVLWLVGNVFLTGGILVVGGALANGLVGGAANALGQGISKLFGNSWSWSDWWDMTALHAIGGAVAGSVGVAKGLGAAPFQIKNLKWALGVPTGISIVSLGALMYTGSREETASLRNDIKIPLPDSDINNSLYSKDPTAFLALLNYFIQQNSQGEILQINAEESEILARHAKKSTNSLIHHYYTQLVANDFNEALGLAGKVINPMTMTADPRLAKGDIVTMYRKKENFCVHFGDEGQREFMLCDPQSNHWFHKSDIRMKDVESVAVRWRDGDVHKKYAQEALDFPVNQRWMPADQGIQMIADHMGALSLVESVIPKIYDNLWLPEAACVVTQVLLNLFMLSDEINSDAKNYYVNLVHQAVYRYGDRLGMRLAFIKENVVKGKEVYIGDDKFRMIPMEGKTIDPIMAYLNKERDSILRVWEFYKDWTAKHLPKEVSENYEKRLKEVSDRLAQIYTISWDNLQLRFQEQFLKDYASAATQAYGEMLPSYMLATQGPYDIFYGQFFDSNDGLKLLNGGVIDFGFMGWIAGSLFLKDFKGKTGIGIKAAWAASTILAVYSGVSIFQFHQPVHPLKLYLPSLNGAVSQEDLIIYEHRLEAGAKEAAEEKEEMRRRIFQK